MASLASMTSLATKNYKPGDVIKETKPLVHCIALEYKKKVCEYCLEDDCKLKQCSRCHHMYYCSKECQESDWVYHRNECRVYRHQHFDVTTDNLNERLFMRFFLAFQSVPDFGKTKHTLIDGTEVSLDDLKRADDDIGLNNDLTKTYVETECLFALLDIAYDQQELGHIFKLYHLRGLSFPISPIIKTVHQVVDKHFSGIRFGQGLFVGLTHIHSCKPNAFLIQNGLSHKLKAIEEIPRGAAITMNMIGLMKAKDKRNELISRVFGRECTCDKCRSDADNDIDYTKAIDLYNRVGTKLLAMRGSDAKKYLKDFTLDRQLFEAMQAIHGKYHPTVTETMAASFVCFVTYSDLSNTSAMKEWSEVIDSLLAVSHGSDHPIYGILREEYSKAIENRDSD